MKRYVILGEIQKGSLFTLFLFSPLSGLCVICNIKTLQQPIYNDACALIEKFMSDASRLLTRSHDLGK